VERGRLRHRDWLLGNAHSWCFDTILFCSYSRLNILGRVVSLLGRVIKVWPRWEPADARER
jgi:hypothetical protein